MPRLILQMTLAIAGIFFVVWTLEVRGAVDLSILCCMNPCKHIESRLDHLHLATVP